MSRYTPQELLTINNNYIYSTDINADIYTLKEIAFNKAYVPTMPYLINPEIPKTEFNALTIKKVRGAVPKEILYIVDKFDLVIAGGFLYKLFIKDMTYKGIFDIDLFIVDTNKNTEYLSEKVDKILSSLISTRKCICIKLNRNVIELTMAFYKYNTVENIKVQLILSVYSSISQIIHGFDLGSSSVAFDGKDVYFTSLGKFAYECGFNIVDMCKRSTSYEYRLKKYFKRGFGIILPNLSFGAESMMMWIYKCIWNYETTNVCIGLPEFEISNATVKGNRIVVNPKDIKTVNNRVSDYEQVKFDTNDLAFLSTYNSRKIASGETASLTYVMLPDQMSRFISRYERQFMEPKIALRQLDPIQTYLIKKLIEDYTTEEPNEIINKMLNKIILEQKNKLIRTGYQFNFIVSDCFQYGQFNAVDNESSNWYGKYYKK